MKHSVFLLIFGLCDCSKSSNPVPKPPPPVNVYVAGYESNANLWVAKYWKNGCTVTLTDGRYNAQAFSITVSRNDVYVAGSKKNFATFWKNGIPTKLTDGSKIASATSIFLAN